ncbi:50S ribosomal protein L9 [Desulfatibacillum aliphaticivorans]|uniref:Large ribosomal subunit protein bL9 n=1 Tax=Desulfatibacillum aliphaticivorans TaxID=218208 RepID=RL9_DESAL|nr:50S ribosomal protein L9 [Desulfatibacillum aliphaticivorans]B8FI54.1 RecName: Full=Large ribosomal subunit protein bL9; AltName: Full=50S ribosomal protein L9 [Desulfatibacillum aliphaticivorans]ACL02621.1 ribosomal protein L9 [Desulfatibacillum aliphaticivorans]
MKVILTENIDSLGLIGSEVAVADGYARNYLLPKKKAVLATEANRKVVELKRVKWEAKIAKEKALAEEMAKRIEGVKVTLKAKVSEEDRLYGSIKVKDIQDALAEKGVEVEKSMILLAESIKTLGTFEVPVRVFAGVKPEIIVEVVPED